MKSMATPPPACLDVTKAVLILKNGEKRNFAWNNATKMMNVPKKFLEEIQTFDKDNIEEWRLDALKPILELPHFT